MRPGADERCVCGHSESMHYLLSGGCAKIITRDPRLEQHLRCQCKKFRSEVCDGNSVCPEVAEAVIRANFEAAVERAA